MLLYVKQPTKEFLFFSLVNVESLFEEHQLYAKIEQWNARATLP